MSSFSVRTRRLYSGQRRLAQPPSRDNDHRCGQKRKRAGVKHCRPICFQASVRSAIRLQQITSNWGALYSLSVILELDSHHTELVRLTIRYPPTQPVMVMLIAIETLALPKTLLTTVGIVEKKPPLAAPLMRTKMMSGPRECDAGQIASMLMPVKISDTMRVLTAPIRSQAKPHMIRPTADARVKPATSPAPVLEDRPDAFVYKGMKNGGT